MQSDRSESSHYILLKVIVFMYIQGL